VDVLSTLNYNKLIIKIRTMAEKKSIIENALLDLDIINEALKSNTKEILRSTMKEEIDGIVENALKEDDYDEMDVDAEETGEEEAGEEVSTDDDYEDDAIEEPTGDLEGGAEEEGDYEEAGEEMSDLEGDDMGDMAAMDMTAASDEDVISVYKKLSGEDEIEVVSDNEVVIKDPESGNEYNVKLGGDAEAEEGIGDELGLGDEMGLEDDMADEGMAYESTEAVEEEVVYEITLDEESGEVNEDKVRTATSDVESGTDDAAPNTGDIDGQKAPVGNENDDNWAGDNLEGGFTEDDPNGSKDGHAEHVMETEEVTEGEEVTEVEEVTETEAVEETEEVTETEEVNEEEIDENLAGTRGYAGRQSAKMGGDDHHPDRKDESIDYEEKYFQMLESYDTVIKENNEVKGALKKFRTMLAETVVFNSNLTYFTKLVTENSTTNDEKKAILKRFDNEVSSLKESKKLYKTIVSELTNVKPMNESVADKINEDAKGSSASQLNESNVYVDESTKRIRDLITRVEIR